MEVILEEARAALKHVEDVLLNYQYRKRIIGDAHRDNAAEKMYDAVCVISDFIRIVSRENLETVEVPMYSPVDVAGGTLCPHCLHPQSVERSVDGAYWNCTNCGWSKNANTNQVVREGAPAKEAEFRPERQCGNCGNVDNLERTFGTALVECKFCQWTKNMATGEIVNPGDLRKAV